MGRRHGGMGLTEASQEYREKTNSPSLKRERSQLGVGKGKILTARLGGDFRQDFVVFVAVDGDAIDSGFR